MSDRQINFTNTNAPAKSGGKVASVFLFLFALPFAGFGLFAWVQAFREFGAGKTKDAVMLLLFGLIFCGVGFGLMFGTIWAGKKVRQAGAQQALNPDKPWFWRADWAAGRVKSSGKQAVVTLWIFALLWNGISSFPVIFLPQELHKGNHAAWIGLIFPVIGLGLIGAAVRATLAWRRFGECVFEMAAIPGALGGTLEGMIQTGARLRLEHGLHLKLFCIRRTVSGSGKSRSVNESVLWQDEKVFKPETSLPESEPGRSGIPVYFKIPGSQPPCSENGGESIVWRLEASAKMAGPDFGVKFDVPVFQIAGVSAADADETDPTASLQMPVEEIRRDENSKIRVSEGPDGREFYFPAARNLGTAFGLTAFFLLWSGIVFVLFHTKTPWLFRIAFGLVDFALAWGLFNVWFHSSRITINATRIRLTQRRLIFSRTREFEPGDIEQFATKIGMTSGSKVYQDIKMVTRGGDNNFAARKALYQQTGQRPPLQFKISDPSGVTVASSIASQPEAQWLVQEMTRALGRRE